MKLQQICDSLHHNALSKPGLLIESVEDYFSFDKGKIYEVLGEIKNSAGKYLEIKCEDGTKFHGGFFAERFKIATRGQK